MRTLLPRYGSKNKRALGLPSMSTRIQTFIYAAVAQNTSINARAEIKGQRPQLRECLQKARKDQTGAMQGLRLTTQRDASSRLQLTYLRNLAMPKMSYERALQTKVKCS